jgi:CheY-like chemotaxis protein
MSTTATVYDLLISCPSDVTPCVPLLEKALYEFNNLYGRQNNIIVRPIHWKTNVFSQFGNSPQKLLNQQIVDKSDLSVAVFWTKFGTPTEDYDSGTEEEIARMLKDGKQVFLYFLKKAVTYTPEELAKIDVTQYKKIEEFKGKHKNDGIYFEVTDELALARVFVQQLEIYFVSRKCAEELGKFDNKKHVILWVDDCPENNVSLRNMFLSYNIDVLIALSTDQALHELKARKFSLVISDMGRREGPREGYVLLDEMRSSGDQTPFLVFATNKLPQHDEEARSHGAQGTTSISSKLVELVFQQLLSNGHLA